MAEIKFQKIETNNKKGITAYYLPNDKASKQESSSGERENNKYYHDTNYTLGG